MCKSPIHSLACQLPYNECNSDGSSATGPIELANVTFGEFTVEGQAFSAYHSSLMAFRRSHACL